MKQLLPIASRVLLSVLIVTASIGGYLWLGTPEVVKEPVRPSRPPIVQTFAAVAHNDGIEFEVDGLVVPFRQIQMAAQVAGRVTFKSDNCRIGQTVTKDELLIRIEADDYELETRRLREELAQADAMIQELEAEIQTTKNQIVSGREQVEIDARQTKRSEELRRRSAASDSELDASRRAELLSRTSLQSLMDQQNLLMKRQIRMEAAKALVQANLEKALLALERTEIRSPIDGVVVTESVEEDGYVQAGSPLITVQDTAQLDVTCKLRMRQMNWLWQSAEHRTRASSEDSLEYDFPETSATVVYSLDGKQYAWEGVVDRYDGASIDSKTRMVPCRVNIDSPSRVTVFSEESHEPEASELVSRFRQPDSDAPEEMPKRARKRRSVSTDQTPNRPKRENPDDEDVQRGSMSRDFVDPSKDANAPVLMSGMFVSVRIHATPPIPLVRLPQSAIQPGNQVWVLKRGVLTRREVNIASSNPEEVVVYQTSGGLQAGDLVVTSPLATPHEGMKAITADQASKKKPGQPRRGPRGG